MFFADVKGGDELRRALKARMGLFMAAMDKILPKRLSCCARPPMQRRRRSPANCARAQR